MLEKIYITMHPQYCKQKLQVDLQMIRLCEIDISLKKDQELKKGGGGGMLTASCCWARHLNQAS